MWNIPVGIVTTSKRKAVLEETLKALRSETHINIFCDLEDGLYWNHKAAWGKLFEMGDRAILLQDDVSASVNWYKAACLFIDKFGDNFDCINFFAFYFNGPECEGSKELVGDKCDGKGYVIKNGLCELALSMTKRMYDARTHIAESVIGLDKYKIRNRENDFHHDVTISDTLSHFKRRSIYTSPCFFQHTGGEISTVGNPKSWKGKPRICHNYLGDETDAYAYYQEKFSSGEINVKQ